MAGGSNVLHVKCPVRAICGRGAGMRVTTKMGMGKLHDKSQQSDAA